VLEHAIEDLLDIVLVVLQDDLSLGEDVGNLLLVLLKLLRVVKVEVLDV